MFSCRTPFTPPTPEEDELAFLRLVRSRRVSAATFHRLMAECGSAAEALRALPEIARSSGVTDYQPCSESAARAELAAGHRAGAKLLLHGHTDYPPALLPLVDAPPIIWAVGDVDLLKRPLIAIIGSRNASSLGLRMARRLAGDLGAAGFVIVSGLARGIDAAAHETALDTGTIGVQAGGIDVIYPRENAMLHAHMAQHGLRLAELPPGLAPRAQNFPQRNRIIAGLCRATVVVEAAERSGSLLTARLALDYGREVLVVPGHPLDARAGGCNMLIRDGATLIRNAEDIRDAMENLPEQETAAAPEPPPRAPISEPPKPTPAPRRTAPLPAPTADGQALYAPPAPSTPRPKPDYAPRPAPNSAWPPAADPDADPLPMPPADLDVILERIMEMIGPQPVAEEDLLAEVACDAAIFTQLLVELDLEGMILRHPGGQVSLP